MPSVGAWCFNPTKADVDFALALGIRRLDFMVNDLSKERGPTKFRMAVPTWAEYAAGKGIEVHLTSWIMPHVEFAIAAGDELQHIAGVVGARGVVLDAEEPWTLATGDVDREGAAAAFEEAMMGCRFGVTGIGYASVVKLGPLLARADYGVPQAYVTGTSGLRAVGPVLEHWKKAFGRPVVPGLAAYRTTAAQMRTDLAAVGEASTVLYWALRHIKGSKAAQSVIRETYHAQAA